MDRSTGATGAVPPGALWERDAEIEAVDRLVADAGTGLSGLLVAGEAGIGKSSVWAHGLSAARRTGIRVLATTCVQAEDEMPYAGLEELLGELLDECGPMLPVSQRAALDGAFLRGSTETVTDPRTVAAGVTSLLRRALENGPVLLAVDDLQWMDDETQTCLAYAARRLPEHPLVLLLARRDRSPLWHPRRESADALVAAAGSRMRTLRPGPLSGRAIERMLYDRLGITLSAEDGRRLAVETAGNPFWALELGHGRPTGSDVAVAAEVSSALDTLVTDRIAHLDRDVVDAACLVAALGRPRLSTVLRSVGPGDGDPDGGAERVLDRAVAVGLLSMDRERLAPSHPLIGAALLAFLTPFRRRRLHRRAADLADSSEARALHLVQAVPDSEGGDPSDPDRAELLAAVDAAAAAALRRGAAATAARFATRALALAERDTARERMVTIAELHYWAGDLDAALEMLERIDLAALDAALLERAGPLLAELVNLRRGGRAARAVVDALDALPRRELSERGLVRRLALVSTLRADLQCGATGGDRLAFARRAVEQTERSPVRSSLHRRALGALAYALLDAGDPVDEIVGRLDALGPPDPDEVGFGLDVELLSGVYRRWAGDLAGANEAFAAVFERHLVTGSAPAIARSGATLAYTELLAGLPAAAEATLARLEEHVDRSALERAYVVTAIGELCLARGEHEVLAELLDRQTAGEQSVRSHGFVARMRGLLALQLGDPGQAVAYLAEFAELGRLREFRDPHWRLDGDVHLAEALIATGDYAGASEVAERIDPRNYGTRHSAIRGQQRRVLAQLVTSRDRDLDRAEALAREAADLLEDGPLPAQYGRCLVVLADIQDRRGDPAAAAEHRRRAHDLFVRLGHRWWADRTAGPGPAVGELSPSERAVAELVAGGATNRDTATTLHLSVRTVENHLRSVYRKLGIRSRTELADGRLWT